MKSKINSIKISNDSHNKDTVVSLMRVAAVLLVVAQHSTQLFFGDKKVIDPSQAPYIYNVLTHYIATFSMPMFVFVSGYLYYIMRVERGKYGDYAVFVKSKFKRLIIPYYLFAFLYFFPIKLALGIYSSEDMTSNIMSLITAGGQNVLWFLYMLFFIFIIFYLVEDFIKRSGTIKTLLVLTVISIFSGYFTTTLQVQTVLQYFLFFYIGYITRENISKLLSINLMTTIVLLISQATLFIYFMKSTQIGFFPLQQILGLAISVLGVFAAFFAANLIDARLKLTNYKTFRFLDKNSLLIYLFHAPIIFIFLYLFSRKIEHYSLIVVFSFITGLGISCFLAAFLSRSSRFRGLFYSSADNA